MRTSIWSHSGELNFALEWQPVSNIPGKTFFLTRPIFTNPNVSSPFFLAGIGKVDPLAPGTPKLTAFNWLGLPETADLPKMAIRLVAFGMEFASGSADVAMLLVRIWQELLWGLKLDCEQSRPKVLAWPEEKKKKQLDGRSSG